MKNFLTHLGAAATAVLVTLGVTKSSPAPAPVIAPSASATSVPACSTPAITAYEIWRLASFNSTCVKGKKLPSGRTFGDPYRCRQGSVEYPMAYNPFHSGDQPFGCGDANKDPYSLATIKWNGSAFVNVSSGTAADTRQCYPTGVGASGEMYIGPCVVTPKCSDLGGNYFAGTCKAPSA